MNGLAIYTVIAFWMVTALWMVCRHLMRHSGLRSSNVGATRTASTMLINARRGWTETKWQMRAAAKANGYSTRQVDNEIRTIERDARDFAARAMATVSQADN